MYEDENGDSWKVWRKHIILELQRINDNLEKLEERNTEYVLKTSVEISRIKASAIAYGGIAGLTATLVIREVISRL
ncbi:hypothetical protein KAW18_03560 [candidate division WOR-3 bacterium]|nr:hypothetical protein [candidate division WOR-3 bacterium]